METSVDVQDDSRGCFSRRTAGGGLAVTRVVCERVIIELSEGPGHGGVPKALCLKHRDQLSVIESDVWTRSLVSGCFRFDAGRC